MCGIAGVLQLDSNQACPRLVEAMVRQIHHRGPDARGITADGPVSFGHARLSIIDLEHGRQPMRSRSGTLTLTFNGEIFNYLELRESLMARGHRFATRSDTEVILHAYEEYGEACVSHFNGQWAFALWDRRRGKLLLSRDRLGVRPLYYTTVGEKLRFASEVKSLFVDPDVPREIDPRGLNQLFTFWAAIPPTTVFRGVHELPPGHQLTIEKGQLRVRPYWRLEYPQEFEPTDEGECADRLHELLSDAARLRLRADVPVGAYLSGGLDSSVTAALSQRWASDRLRTFSVTFADEEFDESPYQQRLVEHLGTQHQSIHCTYDDIARVFPDVVWHAEKPVLRSAPAPMYLLSQLVRREGFKVVLTGEGADEMLGGYDIFKEAKVRRFCAVQPESNFRAALLRKLYPYLPNMQAQSLAYRRAFFRVAPEDLASPFFSHLPRWGLTSQLKRCFSRDFQMQLDEHDVEAEALALLPPDYADWPPLCQAQYLETVILMPGYILSSQGDRVLLAHAVEGRFPFLDHRVVEFAARIPPRLKMKALNEKYILKRALGALLPEEVVRRPKQPYRAPDAKSFFDHSSQAARGDYVDELLAPERVEADGIFHPGAVQRLAEKARQGKAIGVKDNMALVGVLSTQLLIDQFIRNFSPKTCQAPSRGVEFPVEQTPPTFCAR